MPALDAPPIYELQQQQQQQQIKLQQQKGPVAYSPSALVNYIANEVQIDDQQRPLLSSCTHSLVTFQEPPPPLATDESTNNGNDDDNQEPVDGKENKPPTATTEQQQQQSSRFLCLNCHGVVTIQCSTNQDELRDNCSGAGYPTHHFHKTNNNNHEFECCGCQLIMTFFIQPAPLPVTLLHSLTDDRPVFRTSVMVARNERFPTVIDGLVVLKAYVEGLLKGERRNINANNAHFKARLGLDEASKSILNAIGFTFDEETFHFISPAEGSSVLDYQRLLLCYGQLLTMCYELRQEVPAVAGNSQFNDAISSVWPAHVRSLLGVNHFLEPDYSSATNNYSPKLIAAYHILGTEPGVSDDLVIWLYRKTIEEQPILAGMAMDALVTLAESQKASETLMTEVAIERSQGRLGDQEIMDAYTYFGVKEEDAVDDSLLVGLYEVKMSDEPNDQATHRLKLGIIAESRNSKTLNDILRDPKAAKLPLNDTPVGLNNIGNTCYLNSLLQYYFTLTSFRRTILHIDDYVENEDEPEWTPKKIGGIEVDQKEVRRAKKFVFLLKDLFQHLESASQRAISPEYDLAYMALLNGRSLDSDDVNSKGNNAEASSSSSNIPPKHEEASLEQKERDQGTVQTEDQDVKMTDRVEEIEHVVTKSGQQQSTTTPVKEEDTKMMEGDEEQIPMVPAKDNIEEQGEKKVKMEESKVDHISTSSTTATGTLVPTTTESKNEESAQVPDNDNINEAVKVDMKALPPPPVSPPEVIDELPPAYEDIVMEDKKPSVSDEKKPLPDKPLPDIPPALPPRDPRPSAANMMFGKQQDVTECMGNVMYLVEAAVKPLEKKENGEQIRDIVRDLFYGKARQILTYEDTETAKQVRKVQEEDFSHVIVDAAEGKDLYDGLDEYFFADRVEDFHAGRGAMREVTVSSFPPIFQIQVQRVQFDRTTVNVYKSNAFVQFEKMIYLDRYCENNFEQLAERRIQVSSWRKELESNQEVIRKLTDTKTYPVPVPDLLEAAASILEEQHGQQSQENMDEEEIIKFKDALNLLRENEKEAREKIQSSQDHIQELHQKIRSQYDDMKQVAYRLHAVFIHQGQANYGHYWIYIYNHQQEQWWKYNDSRVTKVEESEIFQNTTGSTANPYFLVYIKDSQANELVQISEEPNNKEEASSINEEEQQQSPTVDEEMS